ncbi:MAG: DUF4333 domain-containing protein [Leptolyngbyaceae cyanobacterium]
MPSVYRTVLLVGSLLTLTGCFNRLNTNAIESEIEAEIESQSRRVSIDEVRCPTGQYRQAGAYFRCVGLLRPEGQFTINVTQLDNQGAVEWDVPNSQIMLNMAKIEDDLEEAFSQEFRKRASIDCGEQYRINQPGEEFECFLIGSVLDGQAQISALIVKVDPEGNLNWYEAREAIAPVAADPDDEEAGEGEDSPTEDSAENSTESAEPQTSEDNIPPKGTAGSRKITPSTIDP